MSVHELYTLTYTQVESLDKGRSVAILPVGAIEAHGPHLPLGTDGIIAEAMAREGAQRLSQGGLEALVLPTLNYTPAPFAAAFPGTVALRPETLTRLVVELGQSLARAGVPTLAIANSHLDPAHVGALWQAAKALESEDGALKLRVVFPDITRKPWALRLSDEFKSGACHAGCYETSIVMAERPELVRDEQRLELAANPSSLVTAIREGLSNFEEAGGLEAYFGDPAAASAEEGEATVRELGGILFDAVTQRLEDKLRDTLGGTLGA